MGLGVAGAMEGEVCVRLGVLDGWLCCVVMG